MSIRNVLANNINVKSVRLSDLNRPTDEFWESTVESEISDENFTNWFGNFWNNTTFTLIFDENFTTW
jgi:hypothetical protein